MRVLIVDDEEPARARLRRLLSTFAELEIVGEAANGLRALEEIQALSPDVVFLDIEMPELDGLQVASCLRKNGPLVVFVTAYDEHALKAFELAAIDYLVKPVNEARLEVTVQKILKLFNGGGAQNLETALNSLSGAVKPRKIATRCGAKFLVVSPERVSAIVAQDHYSVLYCEGRELVSDDGLDTWESKLDASRFVRIHRGSIINVDFLKELSHEGDRKYFAVLSEPAGLRLPIARERIDKVRSHLM